MEGSKVIEVYLCPRCLWVDESPGPCPDCGHERAVCRPGDPDDPCRRPLMDESGRVKTRAPLWWLRHSVGRITELLERD